MEPSDGVGGPLTMLESLLRATNAHDLEALARCFDPDYLNETPVHPGRGFRGRAQVRKNWEQIFAFVPDITAIVLRHAVAGSTVWSEWELHGTRRDGSAHEMRGVVIFGVENALATWARFYLEPVDRGSADVDAAVSQQVHPAVAGPE